MKYYIHKSNELAVCYRQTNRGKWYYYSWHSSSWTDSYGPDGGEKEVQEVSKDAFQKRLNQGAK